MSKIKVCASHIPRCDARIETEDKSLCCRYGWCEWAIPIDAKNKSKKG